MEGMLRSIGIPCKTTYALEKSGASAHGWLIVWNEISAPVKNGITYSTGEWVQLDSTSRGICDTTGYIVKYYM